MKRLRSALLLILALTLALSGALAESPAQGFRFNLRAGVHAEAFPADLQPLMTGLSSLLEAASFQGTLVTQEGRFDLDAAVRLGQGRNASVTTVRAYGIRSHFAVGSSLLGDTELMVKGASLLPFGRKARDYLGLPLDTAALLFPCTHDFALAGAMETLSPLLPKETGRVTLAAHEVDALISSLLRLCQEDAALVRWLEATGLAASVEPLSQAWYDLPQDEHQALTVIRTADLLTWTYGDDALLSWQTDPCGGRGRFMLPGHGAAELQWQRTEGRLTGQVQSTLVGMEAEAAFDLASTFSVTLDTPDLHLVLQGSLEGEAFSLRLQGASDTPLMTVTGTVTPFAADALPVWRPEDFTGVDILSVNGDSLRALLMQVKTPLLTGLLRLVAAAPAEAVQCLMDAAEDAGLLDLLVDSLSGGYAAY